MSIDLIKDEEVKALLQVGYFRAIDAVMLGLGALYVTTTFYWCIFTRPDYRSLVDVIFGLILLANIWGILILFRVLRFIVEVRAAMVNLPLDAARTLGEFFLKSNIEPPTPK